MREKNIDKKNRANQIFAELHKIYGNASCALIYWNDPFKLLIAVMLSAQTTDASVNKVTPLLFKKYKSIDDLANAKLEDVETILKQIGIYKIKAKRCIEIAKYIITDFKGEVPCNMEDLQKLPGIGRKTANIVMNEGFGIACGIAVDTHVFRIAHKLNLAPKSHDKPNVVEQDLLKLFDKSVWQYINLEWIMFGREICNAKNPHCNRCPIQNLCPSSK